MYKDWETMFNELKAYLTENSKYNPNVYRLPPSKHNILPLITILNNTDVYASKTTGNEEIIDMIGYEINIYISPKLPSEEKILAQDKEINDLCVKFMMSNGYKIIFNSPTPIIDQTIYRRTIRCVAKANKQRMKII